MTQKDKIIAFLNDDLYIPMKKKEIMCVMQVPKDEKAIFDEIIYELENENEIIISSKNKILPVNCGDYVSGVFNANSKGYGFVTCDDKKYDSIFVKSNLTMGAMDGDSVIALIEKKATGTDKAEGRIVKITKRNKEIIIGTFKQSRNFGFVIASDKKIYDDIFISKKDFGGAKNNDIVETEIIKWQTKNKKAEGKIVSVIGKKHDAFIYEKTVLLSKGIETDFSKDTLTEIKKLPDSITQNDLKRRKDCTNQTVITIDDISSKDLDDAVAIEKTDDNYILSVHIADVSHYVKANSALDAEAYKRGTSIYFPGTVIPMLPKKLSNGLCSLNPNETKLTLSVSITVDKKGNIVDHDIYESFICSKHKMTYDDVSKIICGDKKLANKYNDIYNDIILMKELSDILHTKRIESGSIDFDFPETKIDVDDTGNPINIYKYHIGPANRIIEEFMLLANQTVAEHFFWLDIPFVYRIHEKPSAEKINSFNMFLKNMNLKVRNDPHPLEFSKLLNNIKGSDKEMLISRVMLMSLMKAKYSHNCEGHFGLGFQYYCHFTSPIRRYPDLAIHRIIKYYIHNKIDENMYNLLYDFAVKASEQSSQCEIKAMESEREIDDIKKAQYMEKHIGESFNAIVSSVTNFGIYAEIENGIEGLIRFADLNDDYYIFNEQELCAIGERTKNKYYIGKSIEITVIGANPDLKQIDFIPTKGSKDYGRK